MDVTADRLLRFDDDGHRIGQPFDRHVIAGLNDAQRLADLLDARWRVFGVRVGLDAVLGLVPGIGDTAAVLLSLYLVIRLGRLRTPRWALALMLINVGFDWAIGLVPVIGDAVDACWRANQRNVVLARRALCPP